MKKYKVAVVGATGNVGSVLKQLLDKHPYIDEAISTSRRSTKECFQLNIENKRQVNEFLDQCPDLAFLCIGDNVERHVRKFLPFMKIIDLGTRYRTTYKQVCEDSAYGLPELYREEIKKARFISNPGCYPASILPALLPLVNYDVRDIIITSTSSYTGAGKKAEKDKQYKDNIISYGTVSENGRKFHKHVPEIEHMASEIFRKNIFVGFSPSVDYTPPGILTTMNVKLKEDLSDELVFELYTNYFEKEPFIKILQEEPNTKSVRGTNRCNIYPRYDSRTGYVIIRTALDNLMKGASGQATQNMNLMLGVEETTGLEF
jgi:N-acetyl-gamma-glutamyl-phosphate reductase